MVHLAGNAGPASSKRGRGRGRPSSSVRPNGLQQAPGHALVCQLRQALTLKSLTPQSSWTLLCTVKKLPAAFWSHCQPQAFLKAASASLRGPCPALESLSRVTCPSFCNVPHRVSSHVCILSQSIYLCIPPLRQLQQMSVGVYVNI